MSCGSRAGLHRDDVGGHRRQSMIRLPTPISTPSASARPSRSVEIRSRSAICPPDDAPADITPGMVAAAFAQVLPLPPSTLQVQPPNGRTLVNFDTNFFTDTRAVRPDRHAFSASAWTCTSCRAQFGWRFGDGESLATDRTRGAVSRSRRDPPLPREGQGRAERGHDVHRDLPGQRRAVARRTGLGDDPRRSRRPAGAHGHADAGGVRPRLGSPRGRPAVEHLHRGRQPRRAPDAGGGVREGRPGLHRPAVQHRQRVRLPRRHPRRAGRQPARRVGGDDAAAARGRARAPRGAGRDLREHRRQRGGVPAAADGRGVRGGQLPGPGRGEPQPEGAAAGEGVRDEPRVPAGLREGREADGARREQHGHRGGQRLPAGRRGGSAVPPPAAAQHQQEVQPGDGTDAALPGVRRPGQRPGADPAVRGRSRDRAGLRRRHAGGVAVERRR